MIIVMIVATANSVYDVLHCTQRIKLVWSPLSK